MRILALTLPLALAACGSRGADLDAADGGRALVEHVWIDHVPTGPKDTFHVLFFDAESRSGVYQKARFYKGEYEMYTFNVDGRRLALVFPDDGERATTKFKVQRIDDEPPFDAKLVLDDSPRGPDSYLGLSIDQGRELLRGYGVTLATP
ncbi:MAG: hypothetical protein K8W52_17630 [Deltaproteobacteria bacterium]|nr:hypothetical protein [Deltaproteobacteria bacterium]